MMPYIIVSTAMSLDGYIDDTSDKRLFLSNDGDFDRIDALRAECDAILVGAKTIRTDDPRLLIRSKQRQRNRQERGLSTHPKKVTMTRSGQLEARFRFFQLGDSEKLVYCGSKAADLLNRQVGKSAMIIHTEGSEVSPAFVAADLSRRGVKKLLIEGGSGINSLFLRDDLVDELRLTIAPFFVGDDTAPRFVQSEHFPFDQHSPMKIKSVNTIDDVVVINYLLKPCKKHA
ncbi:MAG: dihydrofolate reductase family protein [Waddliaceae bacterium]